MEIKAYTSDSYESQMVESMRMKIHEWKSEFTEIYTQCQSARTHIALHRMERANTLNSKS